MGSMIELQSLSMDDGQILDTFVTINQLFLITVLRFYLHFNFIVETDPNFGKFDNIL